MRRQQASISKISPLIIGNVIRRERLFTLLDRKVPTNAFWISGPGGSGKTTFVASYLQDRDIPCLWYQVDAMDGDPASFFYYLGMAAASLMDPADGTDAITHSGVPSPTWRPLFCVILNCSYQRIQPDSWFIYDNFQEAPGGLAAHNGL